MHARKNRFSFTGRSSSVSRCQNHRHPDPFAGLVTLIPFWITWLLISFLFKLLSTVVGGRCLAAVSAEDLPG